MSSIHIDSFKQSNERLPARICKIERAILYPLLPQSGPANILGGVFHKDMPKHFHQYRGNAVWNKSRKLEQATNINQNNSSINKLIKGNFIYGGPIVNHYGHFLAECIHRVWALEYIKENTDIKIKGVIFMPKCFNSYHWYRKNLYKLPSIFMQTLNYLGVSSKDIKFQFSPTQIECLYVPEQASFFRPITPINNAYKDFLIRCEERNNINVDKGYFEKIYVSRKNFSLRGAYAGERYIESFFSHNGFKVFEPEKFSLLEQLKIYKNAKEIIFAEGGALHILELLGEINAKITVIGRRPGCQLVYEKLLNTRNINNQFFTEVITLPSLFIPKGSKNGAHGSALSILDTSEIANFIANKLAIKGFCTEKLSRYVKDDIDKYRTHYVHNSNAPSDILKLALEKFDHGVSEL